MVIGRFDKPCAAAGATIAVPTMADRHSLSIRPIFGGPFTIFPPRFQGIIHKKSEVIVLSVYSSSAMSNTRTTPRHGRIVRLSTNTGSPFERLSSGQLAQPARLA